MDTRTGVQPPGVDADALAGLAGIVLSDQSLEDVLGIVARVAKANVPAAAEVSVTLVVDGSPRTAAYTGALAQVLDERQYGTGYGPCLDAVRTSQPLLVEDTGADTRWPQWAEEAVRQGVGSCLSVPLSVTSDVVGALNIYAAASGAIGAEEIDRAGAYAFHAAVAVTNAHGYQDSAELAGQLEQAMRSRSTIDQAKGMIMLAQQCDGDEAFALLTRMSQHTNRKLREIAAELVRTRGAGLR